MNFIQGETGTNFVNIPFQYNHIDRNRGGDFRGNFRIGGGQGVNKYDDYHDYDDTGFSDPGPSNMDFSELGYNNVNVRMDSIDTYFTTPSRKRPYYNELYGDDLELPPRTDKEKKKKKKKPRVEVEPEEEEEREVYCEVCSIALESRAAYKAHAVGDDHIRKLEKEIMSEYYKNEGKEPEYSGAENSGTWSVKESKCIACDIGFDSLEDYNIHSDGTYHKLKVRQAAGEELSAMCLVDDTKKPWETRKKKAKEVNQDANEHFCKICYLDCNSPSNYQAHVRGAKHQKKIKKLLMTDDYYQECTGMQAGYRAVLETSEEPLIGVEYIYHYKGSEDNNLEFSCILCDSQLAFVNLLTHLTGWKHRRKYIKYHKPEKYHLVLVETNDNKTAATDAAAKIAAEIEAEDGRQPPRLRVFVSPRDAEQIMEYEHDRIIVQDRNNFWEEIYDGRPPPRSREELDADFEHWKKMSGFQLPYEKANHYETEEVMFLQELHRNRQGRGWGGDRPDKLNQNFQGMAMTGVGAARPGLLGDNPSGPRPLMGNRRGAHGPVMGGRPGGSRPLLSDRPDVPQPLMGGPGPSMADEMTGHGPRPLMGGRPGGSGPLIGDRAGVLRPLMGDRAGGYGPLMGDRASGYGPLMGDRPGGYGPVIGDRPGRPGLLMGDRQGRPGPLMGDRQGRPGPLMGDRQGGYGPLMGGRPRAPGPLMGPLMNDNGPIHDIQEGPFFRPAPSNYGRRPGRFPNPAIRPGRGNF